MFSRLLLSANDVVLRLIFVLKFSQRSWKMFLRSCAFVALGFVLAPEVEASDWVRFRGPNGSGVATDSTPVPTTWSESENLKWTAKLPGPGLSCPIVVGDRVIVTCWSGYAVEKGELGSLENLKRNVLCLDRATGDVLWSHEEEPILPENEFRSMFAENGYASHTPTTDGERVYVFFGKSGVLAFDLGDGRKLWQQKVGENLEQRGWGSASSPIVYKNLVIVPAFIEGDRTVAFEGATGKIVWSQDSPGYTSNWSTPILVEAEGRTDLVMAVPGEVWGVNPDNGKLRWYCEVPGSDSARASVVADGDVVIAMAGGRGGSTSIAVRAGGKGDVKDTHLVWTGRDVSSTASPVIHNGKMYLVNNKVATSVDMATGKRIAQTRLTATASGQPEEKPEAQPERPAPGSDQGNAQGQRGGGGRGGYGGGGVGGQDYSSPVIAGNTMFYNSRNGDVFVIELGEEMKQVGLNKFASDKTDFSATPAISDGEIFIRSGSTVYCIAESKK